MSNDEEICAAKEQQIWKEKLQTSKTSTKLRVSGELSTLVRAVDQNATECIDLIVVHGLEGHPESGSGWKKNEKLWLCDFLPLQIQNANVIVYKYDVASLVTVFGETLNDYIRAHARTLLQLLNTWYTDSNNRRNNVVLIGKGQGGLIVKQAMIDYGNLDSADQRPTVHAHESAEDVDILETNLYVSYYDKARKDIKAVIFLGTPHRGHNFNTKWHSYNEVNQPIAPTPPAGLYEYNAMKDLESSKPSLREKGQVLARILALSQKM
ncbi:hypothetical protein FPQ18DRAFT_387421 [Pyronema domesticum]|nr:hypothetical protein FPQ18DRAFT_387421 [Pyronema domesticum]